MNYFNNIVNGMTLFHDDFRFIQDTMISTIETLAKSLGGDKLGNFKITGCSYKLPISGMLIIHEGWVYLDGEVLYVPEHQVNYSNLNKCKFVKQTSLDPAGERSVNGVIVNPYEVNTALVQEAGSTNAGDLLYNGLTMEQVLSRKLIFTPQWKKVGDTGNLQLASDFAVTTGQGNYGLRYKLTNSGDLHLFGVFKTANDLTAGQLYYFINLTNHFQFYDPSAVDIFEIGTTEIYYTEIFKMYINYQNDNGLIHFLLLLTPNQDITADRLLKINLIIPLNFDNALTVSPYDN